MDILAADVVVAAAIVIAFRWANARRARILPLVVAAGAATAFTLVRNAHDFQDSAFLFALAACCALAGAVAAVGTVGLRQGVRRSYVYAVLAAILVPAFFTAGIVIHYTACLISGCDLS